MAQIAIALASPQGANAVQWQCCVAAAGSKEESKCFGRNGTTQMLSRREGGVGSKGTPDHRSVAAVLSAFGHVDTTEQTERNTHKSLRAADEVSIEEGYQPLAWAMRGCNRAFAAAKYVHI